MIWTARCNISQQCIFRTFDDVYYVILTINSYFFLYVINRLVPVLKTRCVLSEVGAKYL
jgi:hypothetical protein